MQILKPMCTIMRTIKGFSLIEMIMVMAISGIIFSMSAILLNAGFNSYLTGVNVTGLNNQATMVMARMTKELEQAASFSAINPTDVTFTTAAGSTISYNWSSPNLTRTGSTTQTLSDQVTAFSLTYYQSSFSTTATPTAVRAVTISITLSSGDEIIPMINTVFLNNMK